MRSVTVPAFDVIRNPPQAVPLMTKCEGLRSNRKNHYTRKTDDSECSNLLIVHTSFGNKQEKYKKI
ncbi:MAG: hypothetical protein IKO61_09325 [Lachnospiraceae bacterium]|nr:hypothetical protein [Lachnospiraceae bacterium]